MVYSYSSRDMLEKLPRRSDDSHKGTYGKVLVAAGSKNMCGAAYFAAKAAYRTGAGLVYVYTEECNRVILQQMLPEAVLITYEEASWSRHELEEALAGKDAVVAGPGLGTSDVKFKIMDTILSASGMKRIVDADGLNLISCHPELWKRVTEPLIITPHYGEMQRLTGKSVSELKNDREKNVMDFSKEHGIITVMKDSRTLVSDGTDCYINSSGNHGMSTGGSGDVLSGIIGGLLAQGMEMFEAAKLGVYLHGAAGDRARDLRGAYSMMASDIIDNILYGIS